MTYKWAIACTFSDGYHTCIWAPAWQNQQNDLCVQRWLGSAWASAQSNQSSLGALWVAKDPVFLHADSKDWSDRADAQADLGLHWVWWLILYISVYPRSGERGGSVVECRTPEREVRGSRPTAAVLCPWARHFTPRKYWLITQEAMAPSRHDWKIVDWDVKPQHNQPTNPRSKKGDCDVVVKRALLHERGTFTRALE